jgi:hypothetical protein
MFELWCKLQSHKLTLEINRKGSLFFKLKEDELVSKALEINKQKFLKKYQHIRCNIIRINSTIAKEIELEFGFDQLFEEINDIQHAIPASISIEELTKESHIQEQQNVQIQNVQKKRRGGGKKNKLIKEKRVKHKVT